VRSLISVVAFGLVVAAMAALTWLLVRTYDGFLRLMGDHRRAARADEP
jgi:uncharacterized membrane protein